MSDCQALIDSSSHVALQRLYFWSEFVASIQERVSLNKVVSPFKIRHEGTPTGKITQVAGVETYVALPASDVEIKDTALLLLTDVFGFKIDNNKLVADGGGCVSYLVARSQKPYT